MAHAGKTSSREYDCPACGRRRVASRDDWSRLPKDAPRDAEPPRKFAVHDRRGGPIGQRCDGRVPAAAEA